MNPTEQMKRQQQYKTYVDQKTPRHNLWLNMLRAFLTGGAVCVLGQIIFNLCELQKLSQDDCSNWTSMLLVLISVILTGTGIYPKQIACIFAMAFGVAPIPKPQTPADKTAAS